MSGVTAAPPSEEPVDQQLVKIVSSLEHLPGTVFQLWLRRQGGDTLSPGWLGDGGGGDRLMTLLSKPRTTVAERSENKREIQSAASFETTAAKLQAALLTGVLRLPPSVNAAQSQFPVRSAPPHAERGSEVCVAVSEGSQRRASFL